MSDQCAESCHCLLWLTAACCDLRGNIYCNNKPIKSDESQYATQTRWQFECTWTHPSRTVRISSVLCSMATLYRLSCLSLTVIKSSLTSPNHIFRCLLCDRYASPLHLLVVVVTYMSKPMHISLSSSFYKQQHSDPHSNTASKNVLHNVLLSLYSMHILQSIYATYTYNTYPVFGVFLQIGLLQCILHSYVHARL